MEMRANAEASNAKVERERNQKTLEVSRNPQPSNLPPDP